jgi:hypothetical protein
VFTAERACPDGCVIVSDGCFYESLLGVLALGSFLAALRLRRRSQRSRSTSRTRLVRPGSEVTGKSAQDKLQALTVFDEI